MANNENSKLCVVCGSHNITVSSTSQQINIPYGNPASAVSSTVTCADCGAEIDDTQDSEMETALEASRRESVKIMLEYLNREGYSLARMERALELPQRTLSRWKTNGDASSVGFALMRILRTFPWIVDVADEHFDEKTAKTEAVRYAADIFTSAFAQSGFSAVNGNILVSESTVSRDTPTQISVTVNFGQTRELKLESSSGITAYGEVTNANT